MRSQYDFLKLGKQQTRMYDAGVRPHKHYEFCEGDELATRQLVKHHEGWETLHNWIRGRHGLPNKY